MTATTAAVTAAAANGHGSRYAQPARCCWMRVASAVVTPLSLLVVLAGERVKFEPESTVNEKVPAAGVFTEPFWSPSRVTVALPTPLWPSLTHIKVPLIWMSAPLSTVTVNVQEAEHPTPSAYE